MVNVPPEHGQDTAALINMWIRTDACPTNGELKNPAAWNLDICFLGCLVAGPAGGCGVSDDEMRLMPCASTYVQITCCLYG